MDFSSFWLSKALKPIIRNFFSINEEYFNQTLYLDGMKENVTIYRDNLGIPYIYAQNDFDAFFSQGFFHATERGWQMELLRLISYGRLSEVVGKDALALDVFTRTLRISEVSEQRLSKLSVNELKHWEAYAFGVSAGFTSLPQLQIEFKLLNHTPNKTWNVKDSVCVFTVISILMTCGKMAEVSRMILKTDIPENLFNLFDIKLNEKVSFINPEGPGAVIYDLNKKRASIPMSNKKVSDEWLRAYSQKFFTEKENKGKSLKFERDEIIKDAINKFQSKYIKISNLEGSNAWAVSGDYTKSGKPLLASDPHLELTAPGFLMPISLHSSSELTNTQSGEQGQEEMHCIGASVPGIPGIIIGHNQKVAWAVTLSFVDQEDYFVIKLNADGTKYEYENKLYDLNLKEEVFYVKNEEKSYKWTVRSSHHGPIVSDVQPLLFDLIQNDSQKAVVFASTALRASFNPYMSIDLLRSSSWKSIFHLAEETQMSSNSIVVADVEGNIASMLFGVVIRRANVSSLFFRDGSTNKTDWVGLLSESEKPHLINPKSGIVFSANGPQAPDPNDLYGNNFNGGYRGLMITENLMNLISSGSKIEIKDFQKMQLDTYSVQGCIFKNIITLFFTNVNETCKAFDITTEVINSIVQLIKEWNCHFDVFSIAATLAEVWMQFIAQNLFKLAKFSERSLLAFFGEKFQGFYGYVNEFHSNWHTTLLNILEDDEKLKKVLKSSNSKKELICNSLKDTWTFMNKRYSSNMKKWTWGSVRSHHASHFLCMAKPFLKHTFCPLLGHRGGGSSINLMSIPSQILDLEDVKGSSKFDMTQAEASLRMVIDLSDFEKSQWIVPPGVSGWVATKHYDDTLKDYVDGKLHTMKWKKETIVSSAVSTMKLIPKIN